MDIAYLPTILVSVVLLAFFWEFVDASTGMGYGTAMSPILLLMGYSTLEIVPAVLVSNIAIGFISTFSHLKFKNLDLNRYSKDLKLIGVILITSLSGVSIAVMAAISLPQWMVIVYIGVLIIVVGILTLTRKRLKGEFSWTRIFCLSFVAAFNKGLTGGGFGPLVVGGQVFSGIESRKAVAVASFTEALVSLIGTISYFVVTQATFNLSLTFSLLIGSVTAVPVAAFLISKLPSLGHKTFIGITCIIIGLMTFYKFFKL